MTASPPTMQQPSFIYIVGAQCTGKTTLADSLLRAFQKHYPSLSLQTITEVARGVLRKHHYTREDISHDADRTLELQRLILTAQFDAEARHHGAVVLCDRSGVDPIIYGLLYGPPDAREALEASREWRGLRERMRRSLVILCPPRQEWRADDGVRFMAESWGEWQHMHHEFARVLREAGVRFHVVPQNQVSVEDRVGFVLDLWRSQSVTA